MHQRVDQCLADHAQGDGWCIAPLQVAFFQRKAFGQVVQNGSLGAAHQAQQWVAQIDGVKAPVGVGHPFAAGHADVVHPHHGEAAAQCHRFSKQHESGHGGLPSFGVGALRVAADAAQ